MDSSKVLVLSKTPQELDMITIDDEFIPVNTHPTNQTRLTSVGSILDNDTYTAPITITTDPSEAGMFLDPAGHIVVPPGFGRTMIDFTYFLTDNTDTNSASASASFVVFNFGPDPVDEIPAIPNMFVGEERTLVEMSLLINTLVRIAPIPLDDQIGVNLLIEIWMSADQVGTSVSYNAAQLYFENEHNDTFANYVQSFTSPGPQTVNIRYSYAQDFDYTISRTFQVLALPPPGNWDTLSPLDPVTTTPITSAVTTGVNLNTIGIIIAAIGIVFMFFLILGVF